MRADNSAHLVDAARRRSQATRRKALNALRRMDTAGAPISFDALAREAGVSRSWLYTQPDLRAEVEGLRARSNLNQQRHIPDRQRASDASLTTRLEVATERIRQLQADNARLRHALAEALGERRTAKPPPADRDTPRQRTSTPLQPC